MENEILIQLKSVIGEIEHQNDLISKINLKDDPVFISVIKQCEAKKKKLYKKLKSLLTGNQTLKDFSKIKSILHEIGKVEKLLLNFNEEDSTMRILKEEFLRKKRNLEKELFKAS